MGHAATSRLLHPPNPGRAETRPLPVGQALFPLSRFAENTLLLKLRQAQLERFIRSFFIRDFLPSAGPQIMILDILRHFRAPIPMQSRSFDRLGSV